MSAAPVPPSRGWTSEEYEELPTDGYRRELVDGVLHVAPSPAGRHQLVAALLTTKLYLSAPREYVVTQGVEIKLGEALRYIPDVLAVTADGYAGGNRPQYLPEHVVLAIEIVSESSRGMDRVLKPYHYAMVGIPNYWRVELEPDLAVHTYERGLTGGYAETGVFRKELRVPVPWEISLDLTGLER